MSWNGDVNMITKMHHTGFVVRDLDSCVAFYRDVLGLTAADPIIRIGPGISQVVGYDQTELRRVFLAIADGHVLELIQYVHPLGADRPTEERNAIGASHLAFEVDDIEEKFVHQIFLYQLFVFLHCNNILFHLKHVRSFQ